MAKEAFIERSFRPDTLTMIDQANAIIAEYQRAGFVLTLRQLYYQFVSRALLDNKQTEYKRLGSIINDGRLAGLIDWGAIEDRGRTQRGGDWGYESPEEFIRTSADAYAEELWSSQDSRIFVRIEKDALLGVIEPACSRWRVNYIGCRGYSSQSELYAAGKHLARLTRLGIQPVVLYLGDHDPSGIDMTRDTEDRLVMFMRGSGAEVRRLALNWDQVQRYDPPPNPAKETDSRSGPYIERFGESSWELDALDPTVIDQLIEAAILEFVDQGNWSAAVEAQEANRARIRRITDRWDEIVELLGGDE